MLDGDGSLGVLGVLFPASLFPDRAPAGHALLTVLAGGTAHQELLSLPDGALIDFGYQQWHSDGTELINSGGHSPASANWCMGVWAQTGFLTYEMNHFPIAYNPTTGELAN